MLKNYNSVFFFQWDQDKDGYISREELKILLDNHEDISLSNQAMELITSSFDKDADDRLDFEEFIDMIHNPKFKTLFNTITTK